ncbi:MAG: penicillin-binding protein 1A [Halothiobacillaceae bacterium]
MKVIKFFAYLSVITLVFLLGVAGVLYHIYNSELPEVDELSEVSYKVPMRVMDREGGVIAEFGEERRFPVDFEALPQVLIDAFLAAEDDRFFSHPGVDYQGLVRAGLELLRTGRKSQGGSTITMQVARNFYLSRERTYTRKFFEILLALKIEQELSKQEILALYMNKIFLGHRTYGVAAAAKVYFDKPLAELTVAEAAMLAALPKAPSTTNPIADPERARGRRAYVLGRMRHLGMIDEHAYSVALEAPLPTRLFGSVDIHTPAPWVAEMVRKDMLERFGEAAYAMGLEVTTTIDPKAQAAAQAALRDALLAYDRRHGYRGAEQTWDREPETAESTQTLTDRLDAIPEIGGLRPALVLQATGDSAEVLLADGSRATLDREAVRWARRATDSGDLGPEPRAVSQVVRGGDVIRLATTTEGDWRLAQVPEVGGAFVALSPEDGAILALAGGYDFWHGGQFNRVIQTRRQPGSAFKPFLYSAALAEGFGLHAVVNDSPVVIESGVTTGIDWRPRNYSGRFYGPTRMREALVRSQNLVSIRLLEALGPEFVLDYVQRFGFDTQDWQPTLSMALGSYPLTPLALTEGYATFVNGGYRVSGHLISHYDSQDGAVVYGRAPLRLCDDCDPQVAEEGVAPRVISAENAFLMRSVLRDITLRGTGAAAGRALERRDIGGKTGTTNELRDAWFAGFGPGYVATAWVGHDDYRGLGKRETGGRAALPMWIDFMQRVLPAEDPDYSDEPPEGIERIWVDGRSGRPVPAGTDGAVAEFVDRDRVASDARADALREQGPTLREEQSELITDLF